MHFERKINIQVRRENLVKKGEFLSVLKKFDNETTLKVKKISQIMLIMLIMIRARQKNNTFQIIF